MNKWMQAFVIGVLFAAFVLAIFFKEWFQGVGLFLMIGLAIACFDAIEGLDKEEKLFKDRSWNLSNRIAEAHAEGYEQGRQDERLKADARMDAVQSALETPLKGRGAVEFN